MTTLDLSKYQEQEKNPTPHNEGVVTPQQKDQPVTEQNTSPETGTVTMTGPLSRTYAQALMQVFGDQATRVSEETSAQQLTTILAMKNQEQEPAESMIVYVDDDQHICADPAKAFDGLRIALDSKIKGKKVVVLECGGNITGTVSLISDYANQNADKVFYSREHFMNYMKRQML